MGSLSKKMEMLRILRDPEGEGAPPTIPKSFFCQKWGKNVKKEFKLKKNKCFQSKKLRNVQQRAKGTSF